MTRAVEPMPDDGADGEFDDAMRVRDSRRDSGGRGAGTLALAAPLGRLRGRRGRSRRAQRVDAAGQTTAAARGRVLVHRPLGRHLVQPVRGLAELDLRLVGVAGRDRAQQRLDLLLDRVLPRAVARAALDVLADALLGGQ